MSRDTEAGSYRTKRLRERLEDFWGFLTSEQTIIVAIYAFAIFLISGGIWNIVEQAQPVLGSGERIFFFYPGISLQTVYESVGAAAFYAITLIGLFLLYQSTRRIHEPRYASQLLGIGLGIFLFGYFAFVLITNAKGLGI